MEGGTLGVDIVLVDLVSEHKQLLLRGELDDGLDVVSGEDLAGRVAGVDDDDGLDLTLVLAGVVRSLQLRHVQGPVPALVQIVTNLTCREI